MYPGERGLPRAATMPRRDSTHPDARAVPAPTAGVHILLSLLRRGPLPIGALRPAAAAAGMAGPEVDAALAVATRRRVLGLAMVGGTACVERRRPGA